MTPPNSDYVDKFIYANGGIFEVKPKAYHIDERWQVSDRWLLLLGHHKCVNQASPCDSRGHLPADVQLSLNVAYLLRCTPGLAVRMRVFNVLNKQVPKNVVEIGKRGDPGEVHSACGRVISDDAPRFIRLTARYEF